MKVLMTIAIVFLATTATLAQGHTVESKDDATRQEIQKLFSELNVAITISGARDPAGA